MDDFSLVVQLRLSTGEVIERTWRADKLKRNGAPDWVMRPPTWLENRSRTTFPDHVLVQASAQRGTDQTARSLLSRNIEYVQI